MAQITDFSEQYARACDMANRDFLQSIKKEYFTVSKNKSLALINALGTMSKQKHILLAWLIETLDNGIKVSTCKQIAVGSGVPLITTMRIIRQLIDDELVTKSGEDFYTSKLLNLTR